MPNDPPFDPSNTWWPNPGWPRSSPPGGPVNPDYWTDPFINPSAFAPAAPAPFSAAQLGAMAWHPPILPGDWTSFPPSTFPALGVSPPMPPAASPWPYPPSSFPAPAPLSSPDTPSEDRPSPFVSQSSIDNIGGLFSRDPSIPYGLFPYPFDTSPGSTSRFGSGPFSAGGLDAPAATPATPGLFPAPGWPPVESFLPPFPPLPNPFAVGSPAPDSSSGPASGPTGGATPPTAPPRSVLFNQPQPSWDFDSALIARQRAAAALDAGADEIGEGELPRSKSGAPYAPPSFSAAPPLSFEPPGWRDIAHWLSPNIVDYVTKTLPPAPPFPATPGKIPSTDNPYAGGAALEAATWIPAALERVAAVPLVRVAGIAEKAAADAALQAAKAAAERASTPSTLARLQAYVNVGPYGELSGKLPAGWQAHHLNQNGVYGLVIPRNEGLSVPMPGNILTEPGTPHHIWHRWVEQFLDRFREDGNLWLKAPTNAEYGEAGRRAFIAAGVSPAQASDLTAQAAAQRAAYGLSESAKVPSVPRAIWPRRRDR